VSAIEEIGRVFRVRRHRLEALEGTEHRGRPFPAVPNEIVDAKGRVRASKEQRRVILAEFERSGVSATQFAKLTGLKYSTLAGWLQRYRRTQPQGRARRVRLLEAVVEPAQNPVAQRATSVILRWPGGMEAELAEVKQIPMAAALIRALAQPC
jgi:transposase-like protein